MYVQGKIRNDYAYTGIIKDSQWATIGEPRGSMIIPVDYKWHLLV